MDKKWLCWLLYTSIQYVTLVCKYRTWVASRKEVPNGLSQCHTKTRMGAHGHAHPFGMTPTFPKIKNKKSVSYHKKDRHDHARPSFFWYDTDSGHWGPFHVMSPTWRLSLLLSFYIFQTNKDVPVIIIAATCRIDSIDTALRRPGRFDREIEIGIPTFPQRTEVQWYICHL